MELDKSKVLHCFIDRAELEKYIGWKGYVADNHCVLAYRVKNEDKTGIREFIRISIDDIGNTGICDGEYVWEYFYPVVEPPEARQKPKYRPCRDLIELARSANNGYFSPYKGEDERVRRYNLFNALNGKPVYCKTGGIIQKIDGIYCEDPSGCNIHMSTVGWKNYSDLFARYEWADKKGDSRIIGVKENDY